MNIYLKNFVEKKFKKPGKALDLGAGEFFDVACLNQLKWKAEGVDLKTGVNLEKPFLSKNRPFDLVYSNYVFHKIRNKKQFLMNAFNNLKNGGWFFLHTFDKSDKVSSSNIDSKYFKKILKEIGFKEISTKVFSCYDNEHKHWHKILEVIAKK